MLDILDNVKQKKRESLKSFLNRFTIVLSRMRCAPDAGVLVHLTNKVFPETPFLKEL